MCLTSIMPRTDSTSMIPHWFSQLHSRIAGTKTTPVRNLRPGFRFRPRLEGMEDRTVLSAPAAPPGAIATLTTVTQSTAVAIPTGPAVVTSTIDVSGAGSFLFDLDVQTFLTHTFAADLDITITSPSGTVVTLTTDNGAGNDNVFNGTIWDDSANPAGQVPYTTNNGLVTDQAYVNLTTASTLVPEEAMGAFIGEDPNGTWTITISDDLAGDGGSLDSWNLALTTLPTAPTLSSVTTVTQSTPVAIPTGPVVVTSTIDVSGADSFLFDLDVQTFLTHTFAADLDITITSPSGTVVTLTTDNGAGNDDVFNGTIWDDSANAGGQVPYTTNNGLATDHAYVNLTVASNLVAEEALGAFIGEDPNGTWTITISDDLAGDGGSLDSWSLMFVTAQSTPDTTILSGPLASTSSRTATFTFSGATNPPGGGVTFESSLDGGAFTPATSPLTLINLNDGAHTLLVRAVDTATGLVDPTPASYTWSVDNAAPAVVISAPSQAFAKTGDTVTYTVTYLGANNATINLAVATTTLVKTGTAKGTVQVSGTGNTRTVTITNITGDGTLGISIKAGTAKSTTGTNLPAAGPSVKFTVDNTAPKVTIGAPIVTARKVIFTTAVDYIVTISDANLFSASLSAGDITLNSTKGTTTANIVVTQIDPTRFRVSLSNFSAQDSIWITLPPSIAADSLGVFSAGPIISAKILVYSFGSVPT